MREIQEEETRKVSRVSEISCNSGRGGKDGSRKKEKSSVGKGLTFYKFSYADKFIINSEPRIENETVSQFMIVSYFYSLSIA